MALQDPITARSLEPLAQALLKRAADAGATSADVICTKGRSLGVSVRDRALEDIDASEGRDIGLRVMVGQRQAVVSGSDMSELALDQLADRAVSMAKLAPEDPYCGLATADMLSANTADALDLYDATVMTPKQLQDRAHEVEAAALAVKGVGQAEGATANWSTSALWFATSEGFSKGWRGSHHGLSVSAIAAQDGAMERDYDYDSSRHFDNLPSPEKIGTTAGHRAIAKLGSKQMTSAALPVIFDERVSASLVTALLGAISGTSVARGVSFLKDKMGETLFPANITILDDPHLVRGDASRPWDGEGTINRRTSIITDGVLGTWLLNQPTARQLDLVTTGHASRGIGSPPSVSATNTWMVAGTQSPEQLYKTAGHGLLVSEMFGPSLNSNTGDYSVGVSGYLIENGERTGPVSEVTIAGNLLEVFASLIPGSDLKMDGSTNAPSLLVEGLTIAGS